MQIEHHDNANLPRLCLRRRTAGLTGRSGIRRRQAPRTQASVAAAASAAAAASRQLKRLRSPSQPAPPPPPPTPEGMHGRVSTRGGRYALAARRCRDLDLRHGGRVHLGLSLHRRLLQSRDVAKRCGSFRSRRTHLRLCSLDLRSTQRFLKQRASRGASERCVQTASCLALACWPSATACVALQARGQTCGGEGGLAEIYRYTGECGGARSGCLERINRFLHRCIRLRLCGSGRCSSGRCEVARRGERKPRWWMRRRG